ncbi:hypothetical protein V6N11_050468 [Hibiscus sabdariffa]|uniref:RNase H type-1 domain-containing protein n=2 Tax=Hibiscus sabdariffa TaxID=183260 RepID=A0ABR2TAR3_9ROSI
MCYLGSCSILLAKLWANQDMLLHSWRLGFRLVELEIGNFEAVQILKGTSNALSGHNIVASIKEMLVFKWEVSFRYIYREQNKMAACLASMAKSYPIGTTHLVVPPEEIRPLLLYDLSIE